MGVHYLANFKRKAMREPNYPTVDFRRTVTKTEGTGLHSLTSPGYVDSWLFVPRFPLTLGKPSVVGIHTGSPRIYS